MGRLIAAAVAATLTSACTVGARGGTGSEPDPGTGGDQPGAPDGGQGTTEPPDPKDLVYDCANLPEGPFTLEPVPGAIASEDLTFDKQGHLVGSDGSAIFRTPFDGSPGLFTDYVFHAGMRHTKSGDLLVADNFQDQLVRINSAGVKNPVLAGLGRPNGIETVTPDGLAYITEFDTDQVRRVDPLTGEFEVLVVPDSCPRPDGIRACIVQPNGIAFSPDYRTLYVSAHYSFVKTVYAVSFDDAGDVIGVEPFAQGVGTGKLDGVSVDACGNVYVVDAGDAKVYRIPPEGGQPVAIIDGYQVRDPFFMTSLQWGSGIGGWDPMSVYLPDAQTKQVYRAQIGVPGKELAP